jgi:hypothetical protein
MFSYLGSRIGYVALVAALLAVPALNAQQASRAGAAPLPAQIAAARKVFISNAGADVAALEIFKRAGEPDQAYNHFYSAMQAWGRYEIVSTPGEADLVLEIGFRAPMYYNGTLAIYEPQFELKIIDAKTHFLLWTLAEPVEGAFRKATWLKNFGQGLDALMNDAKQISGPSSANGEAPKK